MTVSKELPSPYIIYMKSSGRDSLREASFDLDRVSFSAAVILGMVVKVEFTSGVRSSGSDIRAVDVGIGMIG